MAALLHDVTEDTSVTKDEISDTFGKPVAELVDGVSKLDKIEFQSAEVAQAENFRKMLLAMARDVRIILIKLADRLHNMRTLGAVPPAKRRRVARETMEIYAPIALRLGLNTLYHELQELAFSHLHPLRYQVLAKATEGGARQPPRDDRPHARGGEEEARRLEHRAPWCRDVKSTSTRPIAR
jgi:GTP pyrophosphokinase